MVVTGSRFPQANVLIATMDDGKSVGPIEVVGRTVTGGDPNRPAEPLQHRGHLRVSERTNAEGFLGFDLRQQHVAQLGDDVAPMSAGKVSPVTLARCGVGGG
jgi:hypothetical protein